MQTLQEAAWDLKLIHFQGRQVKIITNETNGLCSFTAVCNILILRGLIKIQPASRKTVDYETLAHLIADYLLVSSPYADTSVSLSALPQLYEGMHLNPRFDSPTSFQTENADDDGELRFLSQADIHFIHGCVVDPNSAEAPTMSKIKDYNAALALVGEADRLNAPVEDPFADSLDDSQASGSRNDAASSSRNLSDEDEKKIEEAVIVRRFLEQCPSQLTYNGFFNIAATIPINTPVALWRNSHLSVLYKTSSALSSTTPASINSTSISGRRQGAGTSSSKVSRLKDVECSLYTLVMDKLFLQEPTVVWERMDDIHGEGTFVDSDFVRSSPAGGDIVGHTPLEVIMSGDEAAGINEYGFTYNPSDAILARRLQIKEDRSAQKEHAANAFLRQQERKRLKEEKEQEKSRIKQSMKNNKGLGCIIM